jgi:hypothetical protein
MFGSLSLSADNGRGSNSVGATDWRSDFSCSFSGDPSGEARLRVSGSWRCSRSPAGALAIGVGFGMQTLIKNLISGVIVLLERHVRVGDVIEVEGITGKVTAVDIRSSTIRGPDGIESMIPNASVLEGKVTN